LAASFSGFPKEGIDFFRGLARNNRREWFLPRKPIFDEKVKAPMRELAEAVNASLVRFAPEYVTAPEDAVYRFYRDTRFSKDKKPYKDHIAASFNRRGLARHESAGFYYAVSEKEVAIGGGVYMPTPETLAAMRSRIAQYPEEFKRIAAARPLRKLLGEIQGDKLSRPPRGYPCDHPAAEFLLYRQIYFYTELEPEIALSGAVLKEIVQRFRVLTPFMEFLNAPLIELRKKTSARISYF
jgi:uncharacterized protein (TIGR02453 family)